MLDINPQPHQLKFLECNGTEDKDPIRIVFFGGGAGGGKALKRGSGVLTPGGFTPIEKLNIGDTILNHVGDEATVLGVFPQEYQQMYSVTLSDGRSIQCSLDHIWTTYSKEGWEDLTTKEIISHIEDKNSDLYLPLIGKIDHGLSSDKLPVHPYTLGVVLGDGNISQKHACITTMDIEVVKRIESEGYVLTKWESSNSGKASTYGVKGIIKDIRTLGLKGTKSESKFIPDIYFNSDYKSRSSLICGLMDSDGYIDSRGSLRFYSKSKRLCEGFQKLVWSVGGKATIQEKYTKYNNIKVLSYVVTWNHRDARDFVSVPRKLERVKVKSTVDNVKIVSVEKCGFCDCFCISTSDESSLYITDNYVLTHNTWSILIDNLFGVHDPEYYSVFFRKTTTELETNLWPAAKKLYKPLLFDEDDKPIGKARIIEDKKTIIFPSGAQSKFAYLQYDKDADAYYGAELAKVYIDELQMHSDYKFHVLRSRNRSVANVTKGMRFTLNPDPTHWMYEWIKPFIKDDDDALPDPELGGKTRYYLILNGELQSSWDKQELIDKYGKNPQTYTYIPAKLEDNKILMELDPEYKDTLDSMPEKKRNQLLLGSWKLDEDSGMYFQRGWLNKASHVPPGSIYARGWDTASQVPDASKGIRPDWTVGTHMARSPDKNYYICGMKRFQERPGARDNIIFTTAERDGDDCTQVMPQDPGAAGVFQYNEFAKGAVERGIKAKKDVIPHTKSKLTKYEPFSVACQNGLVYIVESSFDPDELEQFYKENEMFNGERSCAGRHDDIPDATATAFNYLSSKKAIKIVPRNQQRTQTRASDLINTNESQLNQKEQPQYTL